MGAFDNLNIDLILIKLVKIGCSSATIKFIHFLTHKQKIFTNALDERSHRNSHKGVPQGGVLSPLLYIIYVSDISKNLSKNVAISQFADDLCDTRYIRVTLGPRHFTTLREREDEREEDEEEEENDDEEEEDSLVSVSDPLSSELESSLSVLVTLLPDLATSFSGSGSNCPDDPELLRALLYKEACTGSPGWLNSRRRKRLVKFTFFPVTALSRERKQFANRSKSSALRLKVAQRSTVASSVAAAAAAAPVTTPASVIILPLLSKVKKNLLTNLCYETTIAYDKVEECESPSGWAGFDSLFSVPRCRADRPKREPSQASHRCSVRCPYELQSLGPVQSSGHEKDAKLPSSAEFATGTLEDKLERLDGLIRGLGQFIQGKSNLHKEVISYQVSLGIALSALRKSLESQVPPRPPVADKAVCTSPLFTGSATSKPLATSPPASHATPKRHAVTPASKQHDENNNEVGDQDGFVLVDRRHHRQRKQTAATPGAVHARQQPKPRPVQRRARHRPDVIVIKAKDASKYADILRSLKSDSTLQQKVGSSVNNIRRSAAGALMLQLKKGVENASDLGEELGKVLGTAATASALLHTSTIEIKDLDECATKEEVTAALDALLGVPVSKRDPVKSLRKAYAGTQLELPSGPEDHPGPPMMRILQLNLNHCEAAQDLLCDTISKLRINVAILCEQYKRTLLHPTHGSPMPTASSYLGAWRNSGAGAPSASTSLLRVGPNRRNFLFQRLRSAKTL
ncbi:unnamed protein product [Trichogramma brassicae]|uniref:Reverse transcriptase domain-containing protein n=1 Tax=Trichogramma brassicae TaxID=86971 RepID=A0A6H5IPR7_9HYME|nr:unnamed protein product [Trichogramma brassicae]